MKMIPVLLAMALLAGCAGSKITSRWISPGWEAKPQQRVLVASLINPSNPRWDDKIEAHIVGDLKAAGIMAVSAYKLFGADAFTGKDGNTIETRLKDSGYTAVITIVLLDKKSEQVYVAPIEPNRGAETGVPFDRYIRSVTDRILSPGYYTQSTEYYWETHYYLHPGGKMVYSVQSKTFDPGSAEEMAHKYGMLIVKDMLKHKVVKKQSPAPVKEE